MGTVARYKIVVAYDGTDYLGWQTQTNGVTVAGVLQHTFRRVFKKEIFLRAASRTDAGVHALGQVATFVTDLAIAPDRILQAWNNKLPAALHICSLESVSLSYDPHDNILEKIYTYTFSLKRPEPFGARYIWYYRWPIDEQKLRDALVLFVGTHDFRSFCSSEYTGTTIRTINSITLTTERELYIITFRGPGFLRHMIRRIVGACLHVASCKKFSIDFLQKTLTNRNPEHILQSAPAIGLVLVAIVHKAPDHQRQADRVDLLYKCGQKE